MMLLKQVLRLGLLQTALAGVQHAFSTAFVENDIASQTGVVGVEANVSTLHLSSVSSETYTVLSHPRFPYHQVRVKKSDFCDPTVK